MVRSVEVSCQAPLRPSSICDGCLGPSATLEIEDDLQKNRNVGGFSDRHWGILDTAGESGEEQLSSVMPRQSGARIAEERWPPGHESARGECTSAGLSVRRRMLAVVQPR